MISKSVRSVNQIKCKKKKKVRYTWVGSSIWVIPMALRRTRYLPCWNLAKFWWSSLQWLLGSSEGSNTITFAWLNTPLSPSIDAQIEHLSSPLLDRRSRSSHLRTFHSAPMLSTKELFFNRIKVHIFTYNSWDIYIWIHITLISYIRIL